LLYFQPPRLHSLQPLSTAVRGSQSTRPSYASVATGSRSNKHISTKTTKCRGLASHYTPQDSLHSFWGYPVHVLGGPMLSTSAGRGRRITSPGCWVWPCCMLSFISENKIGFIFYWYRLSRNAVEETIRYGCRSSRLTTRHAHGTILAKCRILRSLANSFSLASAIFCNCKPSVHFGDAHT
jgi:hypothetical protein